MRMSPSPVSVGSAPSQSLSTPAAYVRTALQFPAPWPSSGTEQALPPQILLFLDNIWDYAEADEEIYRDEVRLTYLHELGHYLGWDEDEIAERGLE